MTPEPKPERHSPKRPVSKPPKPSKLKGALIMLGLVGLILVGGTILTQWSHLYYNNLTPPETPANVGSGALTTIAKVDTLMMGEETERNQEFADFVKNGYNAPTMPIAQAIEAINNSQTFPDNHKGSVIPAITSGKNKLTEITLWDDVAEDGDVVSVSTAGITQQVPILHQPTKVLLPLVAGQPILITGVKDGGGGITLAIGNGTIPIANPIMKEGEVLTIPVK